MCPTQRKFPVTSSHTPPITPVPNAPPLLAILQNLQSYMYIFKTIAEHLERPLNTTLDDSIHMPQNHNNRNRHKNRRFPEHKHANDAGVVQATGVVPLDQRHVVPTQISATTYDHGPSERSRARNKPTMTLDARVRGDTENVDESRAPESSIYEVQQLELATVGAQHAPDNVPQEAPTPVKLFRKLPSRPGYTTRNSSPIFDEVFELPPDMQEKILSDIESDAKNVGKGKGNAKKHDKSHAAALGHRQRPKTPELIPDMEIFDDNWAQPPYEIAAQAQPNSSRATDSVDVTSQRRSKRVPKVVDPIDALSNAMEELSIVQKIDSSPLETRSSDVETVTPPLVDVDLTAQPSAEVNLSQSQGHSHGDAKDKDVKEFVPSVSPKGCFKSVSLRSVSSDNFEKVDMPRGGESEQNGGRRKWYKGWRC